MVDPTPILPLGDAWVSLAVAFRIMVSVIAKERREKKEREAQRNNPSSKADEFIRLPLHYGRISGRHFCQLGIQKSNLVNHRVRGWRIRILSRLMLNVFKRVGNVVFGRLMLHRLAHEA